RFPLVELLAAQLLDEPGDLRRVVGRGRCGGAGAGPGEDKGCQEQRKPGAPGHALDPPLAQTRSHWRSIGMTGELSRLDGPRYKPPKSNVGTAGSAVRAGRCVFQVVQEDLHHLSADR